MWVFCCGMMRAGSTLQYQLAAEIVERSGRGRRLGFVDRERFLAYQAELDASGTQDRIYVMKCHMFFEEVAELAQRGACRLVYAYRDLRDVIPSFMRLDGESFSWIVRNAWIERLIHRDREWRGLDADILVSRYEAMTRHLRQEVNRISQHLGIEQDRNSSTAIAEEFTIARQQERIRSTDYGTIYEQEGRADAPDPVTLLKEGHIRSGETGQWMPELSVLQVAYIEGVARSWLRERDYPLSAGRLAMGAAWVRYGLPRLPSRARGKLSRLLDGAGAGGQ